MLTCIELIITDARHHDPVLRLLVTEPNVRRSYDRYRANIRRSMAFDYITVDGYSSLIGRRQSSRQLLAVILIRRWTARQDAGTNKRGGQKQGANGYCASPWFNWLRQEHI
ncbi:MULTISPECIES: hypothetical protein [unclassified Novosphingobium]|uniref:hypothetical protein n=1 Tax=unclassified Novosphingobium TaxID=2644732 RepID=UPI001359794D|nr:MULTISPECIES: hypothetical protein [unclassified Novosphingobium]